jgi:hypothetical protein
VSVPHSNAEELRYCPQNNCWKALEKQGKRNILYLHKDTISHTVIDSHRTHCAYAGSNLMINNRCWHIQNFPAMQVSPEIYCYPTYPTEQIARHSLEKYIFQYNERRPHQTLLNFTPGYVHRLGNKSVLYAQCKKQVQIVKEQRIAFNRSQMSQLYGVSN